MTPREVLLAAADYLEEHGWVPRRVCTVGNSPDVGQVRCMCCTVDKIAWSDGKHAGGYAELTDHLGIGIGDWENKPGRTAAEVVAALREAAR